MTARHRMLLSIMIIMLSIQHMTKSDSWQAYGVYVVILVIGCLFVKD